MDSHAVFETDKADQYIERLCKHFAHKVDAKSENGKGHVELPMGRCEMSATAHQLELAATADTKPKLDQVIRIVTSHLERFAFRENPHLTWRMADE